MKFVLLLALLGIVGALGAAGLFMLRRSKGRNSMARALALRVALSVALFLFILLSYYMGWIKPTGVPLGR
ncbi:DUF2909 domain-containing protein [Roseateles sp.]|jgi:hypothetical protein|uniref:DUF2909 domain-containing protein n=1 Tax=Roseateles sp. TaxID=1971397 RepID=UPI00391CAA37